MQKGEQEKGHGRLLIVNPLLNYNSHGIYRKLLEPQFDLSDVDRGERHKWEMAKYRILAELKRQPGTVQEFVDHYLDFNHIEWAGAIQECEQSACQDCRLVHLHLHDRPKLYKALVDRKFWQCPDLKKDCSIEFCSKDRPSAKTIRASLDSIDAMACAIYVEMEKPNKLPVPGLTYVATILPDSMVFRSRFRTLEMVEKFTGAEKFLFPKARESMAKELPPLASFSADAHQFLATAHLSDRRNFNAKQKEAIHAIVSGFHGPQCPFILFGPPGTGKTVTLVEAVRLIVQRAHSPGKMLLVCTPSNTAADNFTLELLATGAFPAGSILRIFSMSKRVQDQNRALLQHEDSVLCTFFMNGRKVFGIPSKEQLLEKRRVLICTLNTSTYLVNGGMEDCFSHIFVDEASQADEVETLIPVIGLIGQRQETRVLLAGDPQQLGPVQTCELLKNMAKPISLIERLIGNDRHRKDLFNFDKRITVMLEENYRSHPALIQIPSQLYYGGKLRPSAPIDQRNTLCQWEGLPTKGFPIVWHSVESRESADENGHSFCNAAECELVGQYVQQLTGNGWVRPDDIGIIAPYRYQVRRLRAQLGRHYPDTLIDSVERFQGSERRVIIISTVRGGGIGFLDCDKRFNTAITRPKELLIIVGNSGNMRRIRGWQELVNYCEQNGALTFRPPADAFAGTMKMARGPPAASSSSLVPPPSMANNQFGANISERRLAQLGLEKSARMGANNNMGGGCQRQPSSSSNWNQRDRDVCSRQQPQEGATTATPPPPIANSPFENHHHSSSSIRPPPARRASQQCIGRRQTSTLSGLPYMHSDSEEEDEGTGIEKEAKQQIRLVQSLARIEVQEEKEEEEEEEDLDQYLPHPIQEPCQSTSMPAAAFSGQKTMCQQKTTMPSTSSAPLHVHTFRELAQRMGLHFEVRKAEGAIAFSSSILSMNLVLTPVLNGEGGQIESILVSLHKNGRLEREAKLPFVVDWMLLPTIEGICADSFLPNHDDDEDDNVTGLEDDVF